MAVLLSFWGCSEWSDHYDKNGESMPQSDKTVLEYLRGDSGYADYLSLLESTGMDTVFNGIRLHTLFLAPNGQYGAISSLNDSLKRLAVANQIAGGKYFESGFRENLSLLALSGKMVRILGAGNSFSVEGSDIVKSVVNCKDGIIYQVDRPVAYKQTLWERIKDDPDYSLIVSYLEQELDTVFDRELSRPTGYFDDENRPLYDSVFVPEPAMFSHGRINKDYSYYTVFVASNELYERKLAEYYADRSLITGFTPTREDTVNLTNWLVRSMIHYGLIDQYGEEEVILSVYGTKWRTNAQKVTGAPESLSNGYLYKLQDLSIPNSLLQNGIFTHQVSMTYDAKPDSVKMEVTGPGAGAVTATLEKTRISGILNYLYAKAELSAGYQELFDPFELSFYWVTGLLDEETFEFKPVYAAPGEYILRIQFFKRIEAAQEFDIYLHGIHAGRVEVEDGSWDQPYTYQVGQVVIPESIGVQPLRVTLKNRGTGWQKALTPVSIELAPTVNNY